MPYSGYDERKGTILYLCLYFMSVSLSPIPFSLLAFSTPGDLETIGDSILSEKEVSEGGKKLKT